MSETRLDFMDLVWEIRESCPEVDWELIAVMGWSLWSNRNKLKHEGKGKTAAEMVREVRQPQQVHSRSSNSGLEVLVAAVWVL